MSSLCAREGSILYTLSSVAFFEIIHLLQTEGVRNNYYAAAKCFLYYSRFIFVTANHKKKCAGGKSNKEGFRGNKYFKLWDNIVKMTFRLYVFVGAQVL